jgi:PPP family 3-phenylpropionic acid transporter
LFSTEAPIYASAIVLLILFISSLALKEPPVHQSKDLIQQSIWHKTRTWVFIGFMLSALLLQVSFGAYYGFFALYLRDLGYSGQETGWFIALGVAAEIIIFLLAGRLIAYFGVKWILFISIFLTALRWYLLAVLADQTAVIFASQILHAFSFGMTHAASVHFIHQYFPQQFQARGQALYVSIAFGVGGAIGNYVSGHLWMQGQGAYQTFIFAAFAAFASAFMLLFVPSKKMQRH